MTIIRRCDDKFDIERCSQWNLNGSSVAYSSVGPMTAPDRVSNGSIGRKFDTNESNEIDQAIKARGGF